jgi:hypothetical protein
MASVMLVTVEVVVLMDTTTSITSPTWQLKPPSVVDAALNCPPLPARGAIAIRNHPLGYTQLDRGVICRL